MSLYLVEPCEHFTVGQLLTGMFCADHGCPGETITELPDGPVVVIDGKVAPFADVFRRYHFRMDIDGWSDAAREVAAREGR
jgi:hypothetical protein